MIGLSLGLFNMTHNWKQLHCMSMNWWHNWSFEPADFTWPESTLCDAFYVTLDFLLLHFISYIYSRYCE